MEERERRIPEASYRRIGKQKPAAEEQESEA
ncbi:MAG: hypothetical protein KatS3mg131_2679 [Candidatus Tectimicrobiota bacterium]|nr:MAG: hypothetical protein KatS3mg131_2679 [Candidatus Tectomicrobia bacterium]